MRENIGNLGSFRPGCKLGPGRPRGVSSGGWARVFALLDQILERAGNLEKFSDALQAEFDRSPTKFFLKIVVPLLPKSVLMTSGNEGRSVDGFRVFVVNDKPETKSGPTD